MVVETGIIVSCREGANKGTIQADVDGKLLDFSFVKSFSFQPHLNQGVSFIRKRQGYEEIAVEVSLDLLPREVAKETSPSSGTGPVYRILLKRHGEHKFKELAQGTPEELRKKIPLQQKGKGLRQQGEPAYEKKENKKAKWEKFGSDPRLIR